MGIVFLIQESVAEAIKNLYGIDLRPDEIQVSETKPEFEGDYTVLLFGLTRQLKKSPEEIGKELGSQLASERSDLFSSFNVIKGLGVVNSVCANPLKHKAMHPKIIIVFTC